MKSSWHNRTFAFNQEERDLWMAAQAAKIPAGSRVLDAGAGRARYRSLFSHCEYKTQDFGLEPGTLGEYTNLDYVCDIAEIPAADASFDVIVCTEVLEHVPDPRRGLQECNRLLMRRGRLLLTAPLGSHLHQQPHHFYGGFTHWYERVLAETEFDIEVIERSRGFFSLFGQEAQRFNALLHPWNTRGVPLLTRAALLPLWLFGLVNRVLLPLLGSHLDRLRLENDTTVGYHVVAIKQ